MRPFSYQRSKDVSRAVEAVNKNHKAKFIAGGTNLLDLMKLDVMSPTHLIDISRLALSDIKDKPDGGLQLGALVTNASTAYHPEIEKRYPLLSHAILAGASPQLRNKATNGGNLLQRTRCYYFYDKTTPCNKREPGSGCSALEGFNRIHAILGANEKCIATHPSDMCIALTALEAIVHVTGPEGDRSIPIEDFHRLPGDEPEKDTNLNVNEIITSIDLPPNGFAKNFTYLKNRDRASYSFALVSVAVGLKMDGDKITRARIALGGVAHKPWRDKKAEEILLDKPAEYNVFKAVADHIVKDARGYGHNDFKIELARRSIIRALEDASSKKN